MAFIKKHGKICRIKLQKSDSGLDVTFLSRETNFSRKIKRIIKYTHAQKVIAARKRRLAQSKSLFSRAFVVGTG